MSVTRPVSIRVQVPLRIWRRPVRKTFVTPEGVGANVRAPAVSTRTDPALDKALPRAFRYRRMLDKERYSSMAEIAEAERLDRGNLGSLLRLTLLAPEIVQALLDGKQPDRISLPLPMDPLSMNWKEQQLALFG
ncbi:hypothetical protein [Roseomonas indoligenes]|uniref:Bacteriophage-like protein n=1 Tax=Roseomonas indoligenes TaxID=2820811 RepID=A0A940MZZ3_9PROT|nr:hypothetical protein [Pararoseomonas indoligenes]MBP0496474.1 hypothetical protein [Pararoseomonas indoligenes]